MWAYECVSRDEFRPLTQRLLGLVELHSVPRALQRPRWGQQGQKRTLVCTPGTCLCQLLHKHALSCRLIFRGHKFAFLPADTEAAPLIEKASVSHVAAVSLDVLRASESSEQHSHSTRTLADLEDYNRLSFRWGKAASSTADVSGCEVLLSLKRHKTNN